MIFKNIIFRGQKLINKEQIQSYFYSLDQGQSIPNRMEQTARWLLSELNKLEKKERRKDWVVQEAELLDKEDYLDVYKNCRKGNSSVRAHLTIIKESSSSLPPSL